MNIDSNTIVISNSDTLRIINLDNGKCYYTACFFDDEILLLSKLSNEKFLGITRYSTYIYDPYNLSNMISHNNIMERTLTCSLNIYCLEEFGVIITTNNSRIIHLYYFKDGSLIEDTIVTSHFIYKVLISKGTKIYFSGGGRDSNESDAIIKIDIETKEINIIHLDIDIDDFLDGGNLIIIDNTVLCVDCKNNSLYVFDFNFEKGLLKLLNKILLIDYIEIDECLILPDKRLLALLKNELYIINWMMGEHTLFSSDKSISYVKMLPDSQIICMETDGNIRILF